MANMFMDIGPVNKNLEEKYHNLEICLQKGYLKIRFLSDFGSKTQFEE